MIQNLSTELALKTFEADAALSTALAEFQAQPAAGTIIEEAQRAAGHGFSWFSRPSEPGCVEVRLRHRGGAEISAEGESTRALLAGLLGYRLAQQAQDIAAPAAAQAAEPEREADTPLPGHAGLSYTCDPAGDTQPHAELDATPSPAQAAAESLAAATGGVVVTEPSECAPDPDEAERTRLAGPLTDEQKRVCVDGIKLLTAEKQRLFKIAFRDAFRVPREEKAIAPLITEVRHMEFCDRWSITAGGGVAA